jgi:putative FmdB family regulatory protein
MAQPFFEFRYSNLFRAFDLRISNFSSRITHHVSRFNASTLPFSQRLPSLTLNADFVTTISRMPTYEYVCEKCGHQFEQFQSISAKPLTTCPETACAQKRWGKGKVKRAISGGAGLLFKGSGFYITDYRSEKYKEAAKKDTPATSSSSDTKTSKTESKPAATKSESKPAKTPAAKT